MTVIYMTHQPPMGAIETGVTMLLSETLKAGKHYFLMSFKT